MTAFPLDSGGTVNLCEDDSALSGTAPAGWVHARCPVTCGIPCLSTPLQCVPALDTCDGAVGYFVTGLQSDLQDPTCPTEPVEKDGLVEQAHTLASCGNSTACKDFIGSIDDKAAAMLKTGLASCAGFPGKEGYVFYQQYLHYAPLLRIALACGFPASTVKVSGLGTCQGAVARLGGLSSPTCPEGSCGNSTRCKDYISSINDYVLTKMRTGLRACATFPGLHTCEGAAVKYHQLWPGTSGAGVCKQSCDTECNHEPDTCKTDECEAAIRSIDDQAWACWKKGFQV